jgi:purine-nucleoside phosphorylase
VSQPGRETVAEGSFGWDDIEDSVAYVRRHADCPFQVMVISGSGLGGLAEDIKGATVLPYADIPHFLSTSVLGHPGKLIAGQLAGKRVALMQGRIHFYEGYSLQKITFPVRVLHRLGADTLIVTNAAGGLHQGWKAGDLMVITDHLNLVGMAGLNPLRGPNDERLGPRFVDMSEAYDKRLRDLALSAADELGIGLRQGVYVMSAGPTFETPADVRFLRQIGADAVGMSTVPEVIVARHDGMKVLGISHISNVIAADGEQGEQSMGSANGLHQEVLEAGERAVPRMRALIERIVARLDDA